MLQPDGSLVWYRDLQQARVSCGSFHRFTSDSEKAYTFGSASPEQLMGRPASSASDVFSFGVRPL